MQRREFNLGPFKVGDQHPPLVIAEAGVHHYNSLELARQYILQARIAGVHAIKFQTYKADRLAAKWAPTYWADPTGGTQHDIFAKRDKMTEDDHREMIEYAKRVGVMFLSTPFDPDSAKMLDRLGMPAFKIASADITNKTLLETVARTGKPLIMSTGASTMGEIHEAVKLVSAYDVPISLLHCTLTYPTALPDANLARITALRTEFPQIVIGYSDHTQPQDSEYACPIAVGLGARIVEKHYTLNKSLLEDDHYHAVDQEGLARLVKNCREAFIMTSSYVEISESERAARKFARRSLVAAHDLKPGHVITEADIDAKRPGTGLSPMETARVLGKRTKKAFAADALITIEDLE